MSVTFFAICSVLEVFFGGGGGGVNREQVILSGICAHHMMFGRAEGG